MVSLPKNLGFSEYSDLSCRVDIFWSIQSHVKTSCQIWQNWLTTTEYHRKTVIARALKKAWTLCSLSKISWLVKSLIFSPIFLFLSGCNMESFTCWIVTLKKILNVQYRSRISYLHQFDSDCLHRGSLGFSKQISLSLGSRGGQ